MKNLMQPILYIAAGPSGSGKTTVYEKLKKKNPNLNHWSWDTLRLEWYDPTNYENAWKLANMDREFQNKAYARFRELLKEQQDLYVDNTNLSKKRRRPLIEDAIKAGYTVIAITIDVSLDTLIARQSARSDKYVPDNSVIQQFKSYQYPSLSEGFDEVIDSANLRIV